MLVIETLLSLRLQLSGEANHKQFITSFEYFFNTFMKTESSNLCENARVWETAPPARFYRMLGQTHMNGWSRVVASQNGGSTNYIFPLRLRVLQWSRHLFNYWKNKKTIIEKFLILLIWNLIYIDHRKITWLWS